MNHQFYDQMLRGLARLYDAHPNPHDLEMKDLRRPSEEHGDGSVTVSVSPDTTYGTLVWLRDNGFIQGSWNENKSLNSDPSIYCASAQLTQKALRLLERPEQNFGDRSIGAMAVDGLRDDQAWRYALEVFQRRVMEAY